jgi:heme-degrading monooxygenase HmoA
MIVEVADLRTTPEQADQFAQALRRGVADVLSKSPGYQRHRVLASQESPGRFLLQVEWDSLEAHTVGFRESPAFAQWRAIIGPFFAAPPVVEHFDVVDGR